MNEEQVLEVLGSPFEPADWILLGEEGHEIVCRASQGGVAAYIIEDDGLAEACKVFLQAAGVPVFRTHKEVMDHYGWDGFVHVEPCDNT